MLQALWQRQVLEVLRMLVHAVLVVRMHRCMLMCATLLLLLRLRLLDLARLLSRLLQVLLTILLMLLLSAMLPQLGRRLALLPRLLPPTAATGVLASTLAGVSIQGGTCGIVRCRAVLGRCRTSMLLLHLAHWSSIGWLLVRPLICDSRRRSSLARPLLYLVCSLLWGRAATRRRLTV